MTDFNGMIVEKAFEQAIDGVDFDIQSAAAFNKLRAFVEAYEAAKLASLPADQVDRIVLTISEFHKGDLREAVQIAKAAIAAMPEPEPSTCIWCGRLVRSTKAPAEGE